MLEKAELSLDQAGRMQLYRAADRMLIDEAVLKPVAYPRDHLLVKPWVQAKYLMSSIPDLKSVTIATH